MWIGVIEMSSTIEKNEYPKASSKWNRKENVKSSTKCKYFEENKRGSWWHTYILLGFDLFGNEKRILETSDNN